MRSLGLATVLGGLAIVIGAGVPGVATAQAPTPEVRVYAVTYRAHDGLSRRAYVIVPAWYGPRKHPAIPLVVSPHGRGVGARTNIRRWGNLPALGGFAVINPGRPGPD